MSDAGPIDPGSLSLADLRAERSALQDADDGCRTKIGSV